jgi:hypothetical protein
MKLQLLILNEIKRSQCSKSILMVFLATEPNYITNYGKFQIV